MPGGVKVLGWLIAPGDVAGLVLLAAAILVAAGRLVAARIGADHPAGHARPLRAARVQGPRRPTGQRHPAGQHRPTGQRQPAGYRGLTAEATAPPWPSQPTAAPRVPAANPPARQAQPAVVVPWQSGGQPRLGQPPALVEDRVPGPAALQLEEAIGARDQ